MKNIKINNDEENDSLSNKINKKNCLFFLNYLINRGQLIFFLINILILSYVIIELNDNKKLIKELITLKSHLTNNNNLLKNHINEQKQDLKNEISNYNYKLDKDMIGLIYPEIDFKKIKDDIMKNKYLSSIFEFLNQLEIKLIYLEREINATKINAFYNARIQILKERNIEYDDSNIKELHNIVSWLIIHRSTQLKGIASDKYLACKYVKIKLGLNLCPHRIEVYNSIEEIDFKKLIKIGNVILKITNGNSDSIYIYNNTKYDIEQLRKRVEKSFYRNFPLIDKVFSHQYNKKRIILEKMFVPLSDLYEFKFVILNNEIKIIYIKVFMPKTFRLYYYDSSYKPLKLGKRKTFNISFFPKDILEKLNKYALKLSEDFPNFIRVDLYVFHNEIYLSELTFDHREGRPFLRNDPIIIEAAKNWKRIDCGDL